MTIQGPFRRPQNTKPFPLLKPASFKSSSVVFSVGLPGLSVLPPGLVEEFSLTQKSLSYTIGKVASKDCEHARNQYGSPLHDKALDINNTDTEKFILLTYVDGWVQITQLMILGRPSWWQEHSASQKKKITLW